MARAKGQLQTAEAKQKASISAKRNPNIGGLRNPNASKNLKTYAAILKLSPEEWAERMSKARACKQILQQNLVKAAVEADLEGLFKEAIDKRSVELVDLVERCCRIIGAQFRDQTPANATQINFEGNSYNTDKPVRIVLKKADKVTDEPEEAETE